MLGQTSIRSKNRMSCQKNQMVRQPQVFGGVSMDSREIPVVNEAFGLIVPPLTPLQVAALDLYQRGLNVFPVPRPHEVQAWAANYRHGVQVAKRNTSLSGLGQVFGSKQKQQFSLCAFTEGRDKMTGSTNDTIMLGKTHSNFKSQMLCQTLVGGES